MSIISLRLLCCSTLLLSLCQAIYAMHPAAALNQAVLGKGRDIDSTSFIVTFEENSIGNPVAVATIASLDAQPADVFAAAVALRSAATDAAERIAAAAQAANIQVVKTRSFGHVFTGMSISVATQKMLKSCSFS